MTLRKLASMRRASQILETDDLGVLDARSRRSGGVKQKTWYLGVPTRSNSAISELFIDPRQEIHTSEVVRSEPNFAKIHLHRPNREASFL